MMCRLFRAHGEYPVRLPRRIEKIVFAIHRFLVAVYVVVRLMCLYDPRESVPYKMCVQ